MTFDPYGNDESNRVVGYGAGRSSTGTYVAMALGVLIAMVAVFYLVGVVGGNRTVNANNPSEANATTGQATTEHSVTPGLLPTAPRQ